MNTLERRRLIKAYVIDVTVAKTAIHASRRQRAEAAKRLRKLAAKSVVSNDVEFAAPVQRATG